MVIRFLVLCSWFVVSQAFAVQTPVVQTNNINDLNPERDAISIPAGTLRLTAFITDGAAPLDIAGLTNAALLITSRTDNYTLQTITPTLATNYLRYITTAIDPGSYHLTATACYTGGGSMPIFSAYLTVTSTPTAGGSGDISLTITNIASTGTTLSKSGIDLLGSYSLGSGLSVSNSTIDVVQGDTGTTILGTPQEAQLIAYKSAPYNAPIYISGTPQIGDGLYFNGTNWYYGPQSYSQSQTYGINIGDGVAVFEFTGVTNEFVVPEGVETLLVKLWGAAGANASSGSRAGNGGYASGYLSVTPGESLSVTVPGADDSTSYYTGGWPNGGTGITGNGGGGGGSACIMRGESLLAVAGGGGGAVSISTYYGGGGGGLTGVDSVGGSSTSYGGSQTSGGYYGGGFMVGGDYYPGSNYSGGGGGGYYGGGGGQTGNYAPGGGGSSYIGGLSYAVTYSSYFSYDDDYVSGVGVRSSSTYSHGGPGMIVIRW